MPSTSAQILWLIACTSIDKLNMKSSCSKTVACRKENRWTSCISAPFFNSESSDVLRNQKLKADLMCLVRVNLHVCMCLKLLEGMIVNHDIQNYLINTSNVSFKSAVRAVMYCKLNRLLGNGAYATDYLDTCTQAYNNTAPRHN